MANHRPSSTTPRRGSISSSTSRTYYNKTFEDTTDLFLFACAHGDYMLVHRLLLEGEVKADVCNKMGKSALQLAIENEHFEVVKVLLDKIPYENFRDALLLAIYLGHTNIADFIMNHPTYRTFCGGFLDPTHPQAYDESQFSSDISKFFRLNKKIFSDLFEYFIFLLSSTYSCCSV
jgi:ankyrin repeat protein